MNRVECAETMMAVTLVAVPMETKMMDTTAMMLMNAKTQMHAQQMQHAAIPTVVSSVNAMSDILVMVTLHVMISTNAKSLVQTTVVNTLLAVTLPVASNVHASMDTLAMVPNAQNLMTEQFSMKVQTSGYAQQDMQAQCTAVKMLMNV